MYILSLQGETSPVSKKGVQNGVLNLQLPRQIVPSLVLQAPPRA